MENLLSTVANCPSDVILRSELEVLLKDHAVGSRETWAETILQPC